MEKSDEYYLCELQFKVDAQAQDRLTQLIKSGKEIKVADQEVMQILKVAELVENYDEQWYQCQICTQILYNPKVCVGECATQFCNACIQGWLLKKNECPLCRTKNMQLRNQ